MPIHHVGDSLIVVEAKLDRAGRNAFAQFAQPNCEGDPCIGVGTNCRARNRDRSLVWRLRCADEACQALIVNRGEKRKTGLKK